MPGIVVFNSLAEAVRAGYEPYDRTREVYLVRTKTNRGYALAFAKIGKGETPIALHPVA